MEKRRGYVLSAMGIFMCIVLCAGCQLFSEDVVVHDELFTYEKPFDSTFLGVLNALEEIDSWDIVGTSKDAGEIRVCPTEFGRDEVVTILITRAGKRTTTIELTPDSQSMRGVDEILKTIDKALME